MPRPFLPFCSANGSRPSKRERKFEQLEARCLMDGAGFVPTTPVEDPDSIVGVAQVSAVYDYYTTPHNEPFALNVLANDRTAREWSALKIKSISATALGATVTISADRRTLTYQPPANGVTWDSFYYIVEDDAGGLGKANVFINKEWRPSGEVTPSPRPAEHFKLLEDGPETTLEIVQRFSIPNAEAFQILAVDPGHRGHVRIAEGGRSLLYTPEPAVTYSENLSMLVRRGDGTVERFVAGINVVKPYHPDNEYRLFAYAAPQQQRLDVMRSDIREVSGLEARIVAVQAPEWVGQLAINDDGSALVLTPAAGVHGSFELRYTVRYGAAAHQTVEGVEWVQIIPTLLAVDDYFETAGPGQSATLRPLANDPTLEGWNYKPALPRTISAVSAGSQGGTIEIGADNQTLTYRPAAGFVGYETFTYSLTNSSGAVDKATVTVKVPAAPPTGGVLPQVTDPLAWRQLVLNRAAEQYASLFGQHQMRYVWDGSLNPWLYNCDVVTFGAGILRASTSAADSTNVQTAGVDEADIVETDGRYVYSVAGDRLTIIDLENLRAPQIVSVLKLPGHFDEMYLLDGRVALVRNNPRWRSDSQGGQQGAELLVVDVQNRQRPQVIERTEIAGRIVDSRAVGDRVVLAIQNDPAPPMPLLIDLETPGEPGTYVPAQYETLDQYVARLGAQLGQAQLPTHRTYNGAGELVASGVFNSEPQIFTAEPALASLTTISAFDLGDNTPGPTASSTVMVGGQSVMYASSQAMYVLSHSYQGDATTVLKFDYLAEVGPELVASGSVRGAVLNQYSIDEHAGRLRIATTSFESITDPWHGIRTTERANNLFVLEQQGSALAVVGSVLNLAPTETIKSVRFMGTRAFVTTFRVIDPLFAIDLANPTTPVVRGALKIPGYSDYLHPVGEHYLLGIGRDANEITGAIGPVQVTLFDVRDLDRPIVAAQVTMEGAAWSSTEVSFDPHAVTYLAESGLLAIPVEWSEPVASDALNDWWHVPNQRSHRAVFAFRVSIDGDRAQLTQVGKVDHPTPQASHQHFTGIGATDDFSGESLLGWARPAFTWWAPQPLVTGVRSFQIDTGLVTISESRLVVSDLANPSDVWSQVRLGPRALDDYFGVAPEVTTLALDVLANDLPASGSVAGPIVSVTQPVGGQVTIAADGRSLQIVLAADFRGALTFTYTTSDPVLGEESATVSVSRNYWRVWDPILIDPIYIDPIAIGDPLKLPPVLGPLPVTPSLTPAAPALPIAASPARRTGWASLAVASEQSSAAADSSVTTIASTPAIDEALAESEVMTTTKSLRGALGASPRRRGSWASVGG